jgi:hypothetical protein
MRKTALVCALALAAALAASASQAGPAAPDDGCLVVSEGRGIVSVSARGFVLGRFDEGQVEITDPVEGDGNVKVSGYEKRQVLSETKTRYIGFYVRFRASGLFRVRVEANSGIEVSAAAKGTATLSSDDFVDAGEFSVDADSFCAEKFQPMPDVPKKYVIAGQSTG